MSIKKIDKYDSESYIDRMIIYCEKAEQFTKDVSLEELSNNKTLYYGTLGYIQLAGWIAYHLPHDIFIMFPQKGLERMVAAGYALEKGPVDWNVNASIILSLAQETMPKLIPVLRQIKHILLIPNTDKIQNQKNEESTLMWGT